MSLHDTIAHVLTTIASHPQIDGVENEVELRLGYMNEEGHFVSNIGSNNYHKIAQLLESNPAWFDVRRVECVDYFQDGARLTVEPGVAPRCVRKTRRGYWDFDRYLDTNWCVRLSWNLETWENAELFGDEAEYKREKKRVSYTHRNKHGMQWRFERTEVSSEHADDDNYRNNHDDDKDRDVGDAAYEFELELVVPQATLNSSRRLAYMAHSSQLKIDDVVRVL